MSTPASSSPASPSNPTSSALAPSVRAALEAEALVALVTVPDEETAASLATALVDEQLCACVNLVPGLRSVYRWQGQVCDDAEWLCIAKTRAPVFEAFADRVRELHPYDEPEVIAWPIERGAPSYLAWLVAQTQGA